MKSVQWRREASESAKWKAPSFQTDSSVLAQKLVPISETRARLQLAVNVILGDNQSRACELELRHCRKLAECDTSLIKKQIHLNFTKINAISTVFLSLDF